MEHVSRGRAALVGGVLMCCLAAGCGTGTADLSPADAAALPS